MEWTLGILLAAGHDPDQLLDRYSFEQLALYARCTLGHHVRVLDMLLRPLHGAMGLGWKDHDTTRPGGEPAIERTDAQKERREQGKLQSMARSPFRFKTTAAEGGPDGGDPASG